MIKKRVLGRAGGYWQCLQYHGGGQKKKKTVQKEAQESWLHFALSVNLRVVQKYNQGKMAL